MNYRIEFKKLYSGQELFQCYLCRKPVLFKNCDVHHYDGNHDNNDPSNWVPAHKNCHRGHHTRTGTMFPGLISGAAREKVLDQLSLWIYEKDRKGTLKSVADEFRKTHPDCNEGSICRNIQIFEQLMRGEVLGYGGDRRSQKADAKAIIKAAINLGFIPEAYAMTRHYGYRKNEELIRDDGLVFNE